MARKYNSDKELELLSNENIKMSLRALEELLFSSNDPEAEPEVSKLQNGSLWLDRLRHGELKYLNNGNWDLVFQDKFSIVDKMLGPKPLNPVNGQLWINKESQILMYYDGTTWKDIRAIQNASDYNVSYFRDFLILGPMKSEGNNVFDGTVLKSQFLIPSVYLDKVFLDGDYINNFQKVSPVAIQYPVDSMLNKQLMDVHVNPQKLINIRKRMILINQSGIINIPETNTEFYGFKENFGTFLSKSNDHKTDYQTYGNGIKLRKDLIDKYDFVLALTYEFGTAKKEGQLIRNSVKYKSKDNSVYIGDIGADKTIGVFSGGICLSEEDGDYGYDRINGYVNFKFPSDLDTAIIIFNSKQEGRISRYDPKKEKHYIELKKDFKKPLLFLNGLAMNEAMDDYSFSKDEKRIYIKDTNLEMIYSVFEVEDKYVFSGSTDESEVIKYNPSLIQGSEKTNAYPIVFVQGVYINKEDIEGANGELTIHGLKKDMEYIVLKEVAQIDENGVEHGDTVFNGTVKYVTIPANGADDAVVYMDGKILNSASAAVKSVLPTKFYENQVVKIFNEHEEENGWYIVKKGQWTKVDDKDIDKIKALDKAIVGYVTDTNSVNVMPLYEDVDKLAQCEIYAYKFANTIEKGLLYGDFLLKDGLMPTDGAYNYKLQYNHFYKPYTESMSLWINGIRQYNSSDVDTNTVGLYSNPNSIPYCEEVGMHKGFYVLERPEGGEPKSCERVIAEKIPNCKNIYTTGNVPLLPGNIRLFIGGIRQPQEAYTILDEFRFLVKEEIIDSWEKENGEDLLIEDYVYSDNKGNTCSKKIKHTTEDKILLEIRQDYNLSEITVPVRYPGQHIFSCRDDGLPESIIESKDVIVCYINGVYSGVCIPNKKMMNIEFRNQKIKEYIGKNPLDLFFFEELFKKYKSHFSKKGKAEKITKFDEAMIEYRKSCGLSDKEASDLKEFELVKDNYISNIKDRVTFEWR